MDSRSSSLREMCLQVTNSCPLRCTHCSTRGGLPFSGELTTEEIFAVLKDFSNLGGRIVELSGGEPLVHPDIIKIIELASSLDLEVRLYTSGTIGYSDGLAAAPSPSQWVSLYHAGISKVFFNLQGPDADHHEPITRIPGSFNAVKRSIGLAKNAGMFVGVHFVPMKPNFASFKATVEMSKSLGADEVALLRFVAQGRGQDNRDSLLLDSEQFSWLLQEAISVRKEVYGIRVRIGCPFNHRLLLGDGGDPAHCGAGEEICHVRSTGEVLPCSAFQQGFIVLGNVRERTLRDLWHERAWTRFRILRSRGEVPGSLDFTLQTGEPCIAQIASGTNAGRDVGLPPGERLHFIEQTEQNEKERCPQD